MTGFVEPLKSLIHYIETTHLQHCPPDEVAAGLSNLPLSYVYVNGTADEYHEDSMDVQIAARNLTKNTCNAQLLPFR
jgi:hypothetical protein